MRRALLVLIAAAAVAGCATSGPTFEASVDTLPKLQGTDGRVFIYRSSSLGGAIQPRVHLNGVDVGGSQPWAFYFVDRPPGNYVVSASTEVEKKLSFTLDAGEERYVRLTPTFGLLVGRIVPELVSRDEALKDMKELRQVPAAGK